MMRTRPCVVVVAHVDVVVVDVDVVDKAIRSDISSRC